MRRSRVRVLVGLAVATVMLEWLAQPNVFIGGPMLVGAAFLVWWGLAPESVDSCISRLSNPAARRIRRSLEWTSELIEGDDSLSNERKKYFRATFKTLDKNDIDYIRQMLITGHAHNPPNDTWSRLKAFGFVESDYSGPLGIKKELTQLVGGLLKEYEIDQRKMEVDKVTEFLETGSHLMQERFKTQQEYDDWKSRLDVWVSDVSECLELAFGAHEKSMFRMLEPIMAVDIPGTFDQQHVLEIQHLGNRLKKLRSVLERYSRQDGSR